jgi:hypothetical protein
MGTAQLSNRGNASIISMAISFWDQSELKSRAIPERSRDLCLSTASAKAVAASLCEAYRTV